MKAVLNLRKQATLWTMLSLVRAAGWCGADVKIVSDVSVFEQRAQPQVSAPESGSAGDTPTPQSAAPKYPQTLTIYYKGKMARSEASSGSVTLYDGVANKIYVLDPQRKTYSLLPTKSVFEPQSALTPQNGARGEMPQNVHVEANLDLAKTDSTKSIVAKEARRYGLTGDMEISRPGNASEGRGYGGGGFPRGGRGRRYPGGGGGRFPGGGDPSDGGRQGGGVPPNGQSGRRILAQVTGEYWLVDAALLPAGNRSTLLPLLPQNLVAGPILKSLHDKLTRMKQVPLSSTLIVISGMPNTQTERSVTITTEVKAISQEALADALFQVPADYRLVDPTSVQRQVGNEPAATH